MSGDVPPVGPMDEGARFRRALHGAGDEPVRVPFFDALAEPTPTPAPGGRTRDVREQIARPVCGCDKCRANARRLDWFTTAELQSEINRRRALDGRT